MNAIKKLVNFEAKKISNKKLCIIILCIIMSLVIIFPTVYYYYFMPSFQHVTQDRDETLQEYKDKLLEYNDFLFRYGDNLSDKERQTYEYTCDKLRFFISGGTIESDYLNSELLSEKVEGNEYAGFMFYFSTISTFALWIISVFFAAYFFIFEHQTQQYKNLVAGQVCRSKIYLSKLMILFACMTSIFIVFFLYALIFGLLQPASYILVLFNGTYKAISSVYAYLSYSIAIYVLMWLLTAITTFVGMILKNIIAAILSSTAVYGLALLMSLAFTNSAYSNPVFLELNTMKYIPFLSLQFHVGGFDTTYIITLSAHILGVIILYWLGLKIFKRQDL
jgi:ABC-type transport system involved in multi-copper enzyme maturation permease subunit